MGGDKAQPAPSLTSRNKASVIVVKNYVGAGIKVSALVNFAYFVSNILPKIAVLPHAFE